MIVQTPAQADSTLTGGGAGGHVGSYAGSGAGGTGYTGNAGSDGTTVVNIGGGGGGGGAGGGTGGNGGYGPITSGHAGGTGGTNGATGATIGGAATGGTGGDGAGGDPGGGGGGGAGGYGYIVTGSGTSTNSNVITGGDGGNGGGSTFAGGGSGGTGGVGVLFTATGATLINGSSITGGNGGTGGANGSDSAASDGSNGGGGDGVVGSGLTIVNNGTISGGLGGDGTTRANAITFTGGDNKLTFGNSTSGLTGDIEVTGTLTFDQSANDTTVANNIKGTGSVTKSGTASVTLSGTNTYTGTTSVNAGTLNVTGSTASSSTTVSSGATLTGTGTFGNVTVNSGGIFEPGTSGVAGTTATVSGTLGLNTGAIYRVAVDPSGASYAVVSGSATLAGDANVRFASGSYVTRQYTILKSAGLGGTTFDKLTMNALPGGFTATLAYTANDVLLNLAGIVGFGADLNPNQQSVADGLNAYFNGGGTLPPDFTTVFGLTGADLGAALTGMSGETATGGIWGGFQMMSSFLGLFPDAGSTQTGSGLSFAPAAAGLPATAMAYAPEPEKATSAVGSWSVWSSGFGGGNQVDGNASAGTHKVDAASYGVAMGADYRLSSDSLVGFALAGGGTNWDLAGGMGGGDSSALTLGVHSETAFGPAYLSARAGFANHWMSTTRFASGQRLTSDFTGQAYAARLEAGYRLKPLPDLGATPYAALQVQHFEMPSHDEKGGSFALTYNAAHVTDTRSELGLKLDHTAMLGDSLVTLTAGAAWAHDVSTDNAVSAGFQSLPGSSFTVSGTKLPKNSGLLSAGMEVALSPNLTLSAGLDGEFGNGYRSYAGKGVLRYSW